jgi:predicted nucleic acid-binding protein
LQALVAKDSAMLVWWGSEVECVSALARLERDGGLSPQAITLSLKRLGRLAAGWHEIDPSDAIREAAVRFLRVHPLRAADALQLAAAFLAAERRPASLEMVTLDDRLANAAGKEGFVVVDIAAVG